jgi:hypothetical protein
MPVSSASNDKPGQPCPFAPNHSTKRSSFANSALLSSQTSARFMENRKIQVQISSFIKSAMFICWAVVLSAVTCLPIRADEVPADPSCDTLIADGLRLYRQGKHQEALTAFKKAVEKSQPDSSGRINALRFVELVGTTQGEANTSLSQKDLVREPFSPALAFDSDLVRELVRDPKDRIENLLLNRLSSQNPKDAFYHDLHVSTLFQLNDHYQDTKQLDKNKRILDELAKFCQTDEERLRLEQALLLYSKDKADQVRVHEKSDGVLVYEQTAAVKEEANIASADQRQEIESKQLAEKQKALEKQQLQKEQLAEKQRIQKEQLAKQLRLIQEEQAKVKEKQRRLAEQQFEAEAEKARRKAAPLHLQEMQQDYNPTPDPGSIDTETFQGQRCALQLKYMDLYDNACEELNAYRQQITETSGREQVQWKAKAVDSINFIKSSAGGQYKLALELLKYKEYDFCMFFAEKAFRGVYLVVDHGSVALQQIYETYAQAKQARWSEIKRKAKQYK